MRNASAKSSLIITKIAGPSSKTTVKEHGKLNPKDLAILRRIEGKVIHSLLLGLDALVSTRFNSLSS